MGRQSHGGSALESSQAQFGFVEFAFLRYQTVLSFSKLRKHCISPQDKAGDRSSAESGMLAHPSPEDLM